MQGESVLWHRCVGTGRRDPYNRKVREFAPPEEIRTVPPEAFRDLLVAPGSSSEPAQRMSYRVVIQMTLFLAANPGIGPLDQITVRGQRYDVDGDPGDWGTGFTDWDPGIEVRLRKVLG